MPKNTGNNTPRGHFCKVCGEHKANEKFSGKGHAAHICKACMKLSITERSELMALNKIEGMAFRYLSEAEIKWLRGMMNDQRPEIRDAAREAYNIKFPHHERNIEKKGLTARKMEFFIHGEVWDEWGDESTVHARFVAEHTGLLRYTDYSSPADVWAMEINIGQPAMQKYLKAVVQQMNAPFWDEDLSDAIPGEEGSDDDFDIIDEVMEEDTERAIELAIPFIAREPLWSIHLSLNKGGEKEITFYNQMHDAPQELYWSLMEWFAPDEDESEEE